MRKQTTYLVECDLPVPSERHRRALQRAVQQAAGRLTASGSPVRYLGSLFVPDRSRCFSLFEAASIDAVRAVNEAALVPYVAINEAVDLLTATRVEPHVDGKSGGGAKSFSR